MAGRTGASGRAARAAIDGEQARFASALHDAIPRAQIRWRYRLVLNGAAVVVPNSALGRLRTLPGVREVDAGATYTVSGHAGRRREGRRDLADRPSESGRRDQDRDHRRRRRPEPPVLRSGRLHDAGRLPEGSDRLHDGQGDRGACICAGRDHVEVRAQGLRPRAVGARDPRRGDRRRERRHVATKGVKVSGIAPRAYIGNYKALSVPTDANVGLDGNAPEIVAAIEAAVSDGMNVINLSIGEPEVEPSRDIVARALDAAAAAGVVPVVAAGNDFEEYGGGSLASPGTLCAGDHRRRRHEHRCVGQYARRLQLSRPDTPLPAAQAGHQRARAFRSCPRCPTATGNPCRTSMATPQVAGAAALLLERHPVLDGGRVQVSTHRTSSSVKDGGQRRADRAGGGLANPLKADVPLVLASPASVSFGLGARSQRPVHVELADAGGGAGVWDVASSRPVRRRVPRSSLRPPSRSGRPRAHRHRHGRGDRRRPDGVRPADARD